MCNCKKESAIKEDLQGKTPSLLSNQFSGSANSAQKYNQYGRLEQKKEYLDEKYSEIDMKLGSETLKMKKIYGQI
jgi:hypothetical protein